MKNSIGVGSMLRAPRVGSARTLGVLGSMPLLMLGLVGCSGADPYDASGAEIGSEGSAEGPASSEQQALAAPTRYLRIHALLAAEDDGSRAATVSPDTIATAVASANQTYGAHGIRFIFDPQSDFTRLDDSWVNRDCILDPDADLSAVEKPACAWTRYHQREVADSFAGKLLWIFNRGDRISGGPNAWSYGPRDIVMSNSTDQLVLFGSNFTDIFKFMHETGHALHLQHSFGPSLRTVPDIANKIRSYVEGGQPKEDGLLALDADRFIPGYRVKDTAPTLSGRQAYDSVGLNACGDALPIPVTFSDGSQRTYTLGPLRQTDNNLMGYIQCDLPARMSPEQAAVARDALENGNRQPWIAAYPKHTALWEPGYVAQSVALDLSRADMDSRFGSELNRGNHLRLLQASKQADGSIGYSAIFEAGSLGQTRVFGAAQTPFATRFDSEIANQRHATHIQGYLDGSVIRYDAVWVRGNTGQTRAIQWARADFVARNGRELAAGRYLSHVQAITAVDGSVRYVATWDNGNKNQHFLFGASYSTLSTRIAQEQAAGYHAVHVQAYLENGGPRYDATFEPGNNSQTSAIRWSLIDFVGRDARETAAGRRLVHFQGYDVGDGSLRYDGIWESSARPRPHVFSETAKPFADRFNEKHWEGNYHAVTLSSYFGRE